MSWHLTTAERIAAWYDTDPRCRMFVVGGSAALDTADAWSDIDCLVYWDAVPQSWLNGPPPLARAGGERFVFTEVAPGVFLEQYFLGGLKIDVAHAPVVWLKEVLDQVTVAGSTDPELLGMMEGIQTAQVLRGAELYVPYRKQSLTYPEALRTHQLEQHLFFMPRWVYAYHCLERGDLIQFDHLRLQTLRNLTGLSCALNRRYVDLTKFKGWTRSLAQCPIAPDNVVARVEKLMAEERAAGLGELIRLPEEALELVAVHAPKIDLVRARRILEMELEACGEAPEVPLPE